MGVWISMRPYVVVYSSISVDGGLSIRGLRLRLSSDNDLYRLHKLRSVVDAVMVGANTVLIDNPLLTVRLPGYRGKQPYRVIVDARLRTNPSYKVYDTSIASTILVTSSDLRSHGRVRDFLERGVEVVFVDRHGEYLDLERALRILYEKYNIKKILVEGGGYLIGSLVKEDLVDEFIVSITPWIIGNNRVPLINTVLDKPLRLKLVDVYVDSLLNEVILKYRFLR
jgi:2,5-diamino-6-(ribosylamino)-4(3H)-pyrimidinone 5'-phosphate reductase